ncbi:MAG: hypothetical protein AAGJ96_03830 [Pseudomonadota bacterium]
MLHHRWTLADTDARLLGAAEALAVSTGQDGTAWLMVAARGEPGFGWVRLGADGSVVGESWQSDPACAGLTDFRLMSATSPVALATGWAGSMVVAPFGLPQELASAPRREMVVTVAEHGRGLALGEAQAGGGFVEVFQRADTERLPLGDVVSHVTVAASKGDVTYAASAFDAGIVAFRHSEEVGLKRIDLERPSAEFPAFRPSALEAFEMAGDAYLLAAASGSNTITLFDIKEAGKLAARDTVQDDQTSRFEGVESLAAGEIGGRGIVAAAGREGGLTLLEVTHRETLRVLEVVELGEASAGLRDLSDLEFGTVGEDDFLFVTDRSGDALAAFELSVPDLGVLEVGRKMGNTLKGGAGNDVLDGMGGADMLKGRRGDDTLYDGDGKDKLKGGQGADTFVFDADGKVDRIVDFQLGLDRIDLAQIPLIGMGDITITARDLGARIEAGGEVILLRNADKGPLDPADFTEEDFIF